MKDSLAAVRDELRVAARSAGPPEVRAAYRRAFREVACALDAERTGDKHSLGRTVVEALRAINHAQNIDREARLAAVSGQAPAACRGVA